MATRKNSDYENDDDHYAGYDFGDYYYDDDDVLSLAWDIGFLPS